MLSLYLTEGEEEYLKESDVEMCARVTFNKTQ